jgi:hypothetical protein
VDRRAVDEHVERPQFAGDGSDRDLVGDVEPHGPHVAVDARHRSRVARPGDHRVPGLRELAHDFEAEAAIGAGDERDGHCLAV